MRSGLRLCRAGERLPSAGRPGRGRVGAVDDPGRRHRVRRGYGRRGASLLEEETGLLGHVEGIAAVSDRLIRALPGTGVARVNAIDLLYRVTIAGGTLRDEPVARPIAPPGSPGRPRPRGVDVSIAFPRSRRPSATRRPSARVERRRVHRWASRSDDRTLVLPTDFASVRARAGRRPHRPTPPARRRGAPSPGPPHTRSPAARRDIPTPSPTAPEMNPMIGGLTIEPTTGPWWNAAHDGRPARVQIPGAATIMG